MEVREEVVKKELAENDKNKFCESKSQCMCQIFAKHSLELQNFFGHNVED